MSYRVIQWATGSMGKTCLRGIIDHPDLELVGLYVYNPKKVGVDAGDIAHKPVTGVIATNQIEDILQLDADVVIHAPQLNAPYSSHNEDICRLLASGKNVISINGHSYPQHWGKDYMQPFFITDKIATVATSICLEIEHIQSTEIIDCRVMQNPNYVFDMLGFGSPFEELNPNDLEWEPAEILNGMYAEVVAHLAQRLGYKLDRVESDHVMYPATKDNGISGGKRIITQSIHWVMENAHLDNPEYDTWSVTIKGLPSIDIRVDLGVPADHPYKTTPKQYGVTGSLINAIPGLVEAAPGIRETPLGDLYQAL